MTRERLEQLCAVAMEARAAYHGFPSRRGEPMTPAERVDLDIREGVLLRACSVAVVEYENAVKDYLTQTAGDKVVALPPRAS